MSLSVLNSFYKNDLKFTARLLNKRNFSTMKKNMLIEKKIEELRNSQNLEYKIYNLTPTAKRIIGLNIKI